MFFFGKHHKTLRFLFVVYKSVGRDLTNRMHGSCLYGDKRVWTAFIWTMNYKCRPSLFVFKPLLCLSIASCTGLRALAMS